MFGKNIINDWLGDANDAAVFGKLLKCLTDISSEY